MIRVYSSELTRRPGGAGDDNALPTYGLRTKVRRVGWATLTKRKWINSGERRRRDWVQIGARLDRITHFRSLGPLPVNLGLADEGLCRVFNAFPAPNVDWEAVQFSLREALLAIRRIHLANRWEIYVKCLILGAKRRMCNGLRKIAHAQLEEAIASMQTGTDRGEALVCPDAQEASEVNAATQLPGP